MIITAAHVPAIVALIAGILILIMPRLLNFIVAIYLIFVGLVGLGVLKWLHLLATRKAPSARLRGTRQNGVRRATPNTHFRILSAMAKAVAKPKKIAAKSKASAPARKAPPAAARKALKKARRAKVAAKPAAKAARVAAKAGKWVYTFGDGKAEGKAGLRDLLGGKGANLAEMANLGLPVPPGFTIPTSVCTYFYAHGKTYPKELKAQVEKALDHVGKLDRQDIRRRRGIRCWSRCAPAPAPRCRA